MTKQADIRPMARARSSARTAKWYATTRWTDPSYGVANATFNGKRAAHYGMIARPDLRLDAEEAS